MSQTAELNIKGTAFLMARRDVLFASLHQYPFYPGTGDVDEAGEGEGEGFNINVPFNAGCGDSDYAAAFQDVLAPIADAFAPQLVLVSAGFDAHRDDPLGGMRASDEGYAAMMGVVIDIAELLQPLEHGRHRPAAAIDRYASAGRQNAVEVLEYAAARDVRDPMDDAFHLVVRQHASRHPRVERRRP